MKLARKQSFFRNSRLRDIRPPELIFTDFPELATLETDDQPLTYKSNRKGLREEEHEALLETNNKNGIKCVWKGNFIHDDDLSPSDLRFSWSFNWSFFKTAGYDGLSGHITITAQNHSFSPQNIDVDLNENPQTIETFVEHVRNGSYCPAIFEYHLIPYRRPLQEEKVSYDEMFLPSELNDTILVIEKKRLHVNRVFLSIHSDFFRTLFSPKFKEGEMDEIPINYVSYEDFGLLMSTIYPKTVYPNDNTVEKLLELADRFLVLSVIGHVEYHLLYNTRISFEKIIWMADKYGMTKLFEKSMRELNTVEKAKKLQTSPEYKKLSKDAKAEILDRLFKMV